MSRTNELPVRGSTELSPLRVVIFRYRRLLVRWLGGKSGPSLHTKLGLALILFLLSFSIKAVQAVDLSPVMYTRHQPGFGMSAEYDRDASSIVEGAGILKPRDWDPGDTSLLARDPGYSIFLSVVYSRTATSYFYVQLIQNAINSVSPVLIFLIGGLLITWRVGFVGGILAAVSHHLSYYSNLVLPDSLSALPVLLAVYVLVRAKRSRHPTLVAYGLAGLLLGLGAWLRPNLLLMGPILAIVLTLASSRRLQEMRRACLVAILPLLVVAPITIRNYLIFHQFVPISENMGIVLWEGIGDAGGGEFGALTEDRAVANEESVMYGNPRYAEAWSSPDGISRDRDRIKRSLAVIIRHPIWFGGAMAGRMRKMVSYVAEADLIQGSPPDDSGGQLEPAAEDTDKPEKAARRRESALRQEIARGRALAFGEAISRVRPAARSLQRIAKETSEPLALLGLALVLIFAPRRSLMLLGVPLYYLVVQSTMHLEFRYTLPMHYFLFLFAATVWTLIGAAVWRLMRMMARWCVERI